VRADVKFHDLRSSEFSTQKAEACATSPVGAPAWLETDEYNLVATPDLEGLPNRKQ
jgi:hypothetical protein